MLFYAQCFHLAIIMMFVCINKITWEEEPNINNFVWEAPNLKQLKSTPKIQLSGEQVKFL